MRLPCFQFNFELTDTGKLTRNAYSFADFFTVSSVLTKWSSVYETLLMGLRHFLAFQVTKKLSGQGKEVDDLKTPGTLVNTRYMYIRAESTSLFRFEAIFASVFV